MDGYGARINTDNISTLKYGFILPVKNGIICYMKKASLFLLMAVVVAGCHKSSDEIVVDDSYYDYEFEQVTTQPIYINTPTQSQRISADLKRDLVVETDHHVIQMVGNPGTNYKYYVWTGNQDMKTADPDVIVDRGTVMVRSDEQ